MRIHLLPAALALVVCSTVPRADPAGGTIRGRVLLVSSGHAVSPIPADRVFVYLVDKTMPRHKPEPPPTRRIVQQNIQFSPHVLVVQKGTKVEFPNMESSPQAHNVFSPLPFFDLGRFMPGGKQPSKVFDVADGPSFEHQIYCDIHICMWARIKVVDALGPEYIQEVDANGNYTFTNVPPGSYEVWAWSVASTAVSSGSPPHPLAAGATWDVGDLKVQLGNLGLVHKNKRGQKYDPYSGPCPKQ